MTASTGCARTRRSSSAPSARRACPTTSRSGACSSRSGGRSSSTSTSARSGCSTRSTARSPTRRGIDLVVVRENVEGEYSEVGGRLYAGQEGELAAQLAVFTRRGTERVVRYAFARAAERSGRLVLGDEVQRHHPHDAVLGRGRRAVAAEHPDIEVERCSSTRCARGSSPARVASTSSSARTSSATSSATSRRPWPAASASRRRRTSTPSATTRRCSSRCTARRPTSPGRGSRTRSGRSGPGR